jgi:hypothetical protein
LLVLVFDELDKDNKRLLIVLDGFDHVLAGTGLTRNLWDQLRSLGEKGSLRLVTGSRRPSVSSARPTSRVRRTFGRSSTTRPSRSVRSTSQIGTS